MNSLIFAAFSRILFGVMLVVSVYVLYRGHDEPGGGFVGGLIAAAGFATLALARGVEVARATLRFEPTSASSPRCSAACRGCGWTAPS